MSEFISWEEMTVLEQMQCLYLDMYKVAYGMRPRGIDTSTWTEAEFLNVFEQLAEVIQREEEQRKINETEAAVRFEAQIDSLIAAGAVSRTAARTGAPCPAGGLRLARPALGAGGGAGGLLCQRRVRIQDRRSAEPGAVAVWRQSFPRSQRRLAQGPALGQGHALCARPGLGRHAGAGRLPTGAAQPKRFARLITPRPKIPAIPGTDLHVGLANPLDVRREQLVIQSLLFDKRTINYSETGTRRPFRSRSPDRWQKPLLKPCPGLRH